MAMPSPGYILATLTAANSLVDPAKVIGEGVFKDTSRTNTTGRIYVPFHQQHDIHHETTDEILPVLVASVFMKALVNIAIYGSSPEEQQL